MKIKRLTATEVHGHLPINVEFFDDITFLTGLNGSGKTTALRLAIALLTPNLDELGSITYSRASVLVITDNHEEIVVSSSRIHDDAITLSISSLNDELRINSVELELLQEAKRREEQRSPVVAQFVSSEIYQAIRQMSTPMFLGIDRRFMMPVSGYDDTYDAKRREYILARRYWPDAQDSRKIPPTTGLIEVNFLVVTRMQEIRAEQEQLDERLRTKFFAKAFEYKPSAFMGKDKQLPSRRELNTYRKQLAKIELAAEGVKIPIPEIQAALIEFFERMSKVVESLDKSTDIQLSKRRSGKRDTSKQQPKNELSDVYFDWIINRPQADRIVEHLSMLEEYIENRALLHEPISRFLNLVNSFFAQTKKKVDVTSSGQLTVSISGSIEEQAISALSSGERQLLVMLAHLSLNPSLTGSGVWSCYKVVEQIKSEKNRKL
ncbi:MAG: hypothetical protein DCE90_09165, partial [Pseudanabaena sp.]